MSEKKEPINIKDLKQEDKDFLAAIIIEKISKRKDFTLNNPSHAFSYGYLAALSKTSESTVDIICEHMKKDYEQYLEFVKRSTKKN